MTKRYVSTKNNVLLEANKILPTVSPLYVVNPLFGTLKNKWENVTWKNVRKLK
jgi:hypothetical protein